MTATMPRPGSVITTRTSPPSRTIPVDTGVWFAAGLADRGELAPVPVTSLSDFINKFGSRQSYSVLYDAIETYFREGGARAYISRVVGPAAVIAAVNLLDGAAATSLVVRAAKGPGAWANTLRVTVTAGSGAGLYKITISDTVLGTLETSPDLANQLDAVAWSQGSQYVDITLGASALNPANVANAAFTGGADDRAAITDAQWRTALDRFSKDLGPGQVTQVGRTTTTAHTDTLAHAAAKNRFAVLDGPDSPTTTSETDAAVAQRGPNDTYGMLFAPWLVIPGATPGTTRVVPPSAAVAGRIASVEGGGKSPNAPAAGMPEGQLASVIGLSQPSYDNGSGVDVTRDAMYSSGVNQIVYRYGAFEVFGWRTLTNPNGANQDWINAGNARFRMAILAKAAMIAEAYILDELNASDISSFGADLKGMLAPYWPQSLYGATPEEAYVVDTGPGVNTPESIAALELHAAIGVRMSPSAELVVIEISKTPTTQSL